MRPAWAKGRNYDAAQLKFYTASTGFLVGSSLLGGPDLLGGTGVDTLLEATFTSLTITSPTTVESGLFVHREVEMCTLTATLPEKKDLRGMFFAVKYGATELYRGRIFKVESSEAVEVWASYKPGNTAVKTHRIALTATSGEEALAGMSTPPRTLTTETLAQRITSWTGLAVTTQAPAIDLPVGWVNSAWDTATVKKVYLPGDSLGSLLDTLRSEAKLRNMTFLYQPLAAQPFVLKPNNQWLTGTSATVLTFSDDPAHVIGQATDPGDAFTHTGRYVGYSSLGESEDESLFTNAATIRWGQYDVESPPPDGPVEVKFGPYRASGASQRDATVDLGTLDIAPGATNPYWFARTVEAILPLRAASRPYVSQLDTPLQSVQQLSGTVPGMARLERDGGSELVAVLGRDHSITPDRWLVRYTLGPPHLLDRSSDLEPGTPEVDPVTGPSGARILHWVVPDYPTDAVIYEAEFSAPVGTTLVTSDQAVVGGALNLVIAPAPGTARQLVLSGTSGDGFYVLYTSNQGAGSGNPSDLWREGPVAYLGAAT